VCVDGHKDLVDVFSFVQMCLEPAQTAQWPVRKGSTQQSCQDSPEAVEGAGRQRKAEEAPPSPLPWWWSS